MDELAEVQAQRQDAQGDRAQLIVDIAQMQAKRDIAITQRDTLIQERDRLQDEQDQLQQLYDMTSDQLAVQALQQAIGIPVVDIQILEFLDPSKVRGVLVIQRVRRPDGTYEDRPITP